MTTIQKRTLFFDIDGVLACHDAKTGHDVSFYLAHGAIITAIKTHYIFPGVMELMKLLCQTEGIRFAFFSASKTSERNPLFVDALLTQAIGKEHYETTKEKIQVLSENDMVPCSKKQKDEHHKTYGVFLDERVKDIARFLKDDESIEHAILIEDQPPFCGPNLGKNLIALRFSETQRCFRDSSRFTYRNAQFDADGKTRLPCNLSRASDPSLYNVEQGDEIVITKAEESYQLHFLHSVTHQLATHVVLKEQEPDLFSAIHEHSSERKKDERDTLIYQKIDELEGKTYTLWREANRIYYLTGLLFHAIETAEREQRPVRDILFEFQYKKSTDDTRFHKSEYELDNHKTICLHDGMFFYGLKKLRTINPHLQFITPELYSQAGKMAKTVEQEQLIQNALNNNAKDDCSIM